MANCKDCWCEHYDKNKGNCDQCMKNVAEKESPDLRVILKERAVKQMENNKNKKATKQNW